VMTTLWPRKCVTRNNPSNIIPAFTFSLPASFSRQSSSHSLHTNIGINNRVITVVVVVVVVVCRVPTANAPDVQPLVLDVPTCTARDPSSERYNYWARNGR